MALGDVYVAASGARGPFHDLGSLPGRWQSLVVSFTGSEKREIRFPEPSESTCEN